MTQIVHETYEESSPSKETMAAAFEEWVSYLPGIGKGVAQLFADDRVTWALDKAGGLKGKKVLELGPLEAAHSYMLASAGASSVLAIEANRKCFLKCLVVKELYGLDQVHFELGNFMPWFEQNEERFDYVQCAGVLYHMVEPVRLLENVASLTEQIYIWTQYADMEAMPSDDARYVAGIVGTEEREWRGAPYTAYRRRYNGSPSSSATFCGGVHTSPVWIEKNTILRVLDQLGFDCEVAHDMPDHPNGPACSVFAQKRSA